MAEEDGADTTDEGAERGDGVALFVCVDCGESGAEISHVNAPSVLRRTLGIWVGGVNSGRFRTVAHHRASAPCQSRLWVGPRRWTSRLHSQASGRINPPALLVSRALVRASGWRFHLSHRCSKLRLVSMPSSPVAEASAPSLASARKSCGTCRLREFRPQAEVISGVLAKRDTLAVCQRVAARASATRARAAHPNGLTLVVRHCWRC